MPYRSVRKLRNAPRPRVQYTRAACFANRWRQRRWFLVGDSDVSLRVTKQALIATLISGTVTAVVAAVAVTKAPILATRSPIQTTPRPTKPAVILARALATLPRKWCANLH